MSLDVDPAGFVEEEASAGRCASPGDDLSDALRITEAGEREGTGLLRVLRDAWRDGIDSGDADGAGVSALEEARARLAASRA